MTPTNTAAWMPAPRAQLEAGPAPYTDPREHEIVVRNHAVAINPVDWIKQVAGNLLMSWIAYPCVLGSDVAGEVVQVGAGVSRFEVGDRVLGHAVGVEKSRNTPAEGAFQTYTVLLDHMAATIPDDMSYASGAVLPLGVSTAASALFQHDALALQHPGIAARPTGQTVLVWGGATSVGSNAIQLAAAAGYEVLTTCSPHNTDYVLSLGASLAFDYNSPSVVGDLRDAMRSRTLAGALALGNGSADPCIRVTAACHGRKFVCLASSPVSFAALAGHPRRLPLLLTQMGASGIRSQVKAQTRRVTTKFVWGSSLMDNEVGPLIYEDFLPRALADGRYRAAPDPLIIGNGLEHIQAGLDVQRQGVSARKVVVTLTAQ
ncbi:MAG TPA: zinc-binding alcohol dehydrogenase family protein [Pseudonocardiaceae bacterium]|nr:zinc-binding alcohol dehydrogenase family protein [Pseudonocardiaceae bacterium]